jgi:hypothetical protein
MNSASPKIRSIKEVVSAIAARLSKYHDTFASLQRKLANLWVVSLNYTLGVE